MTLPPRRLADEVLVALTSGNLEDVRRLCAPNIVLYGTDEGERWSDLDSLCDALVGLRAYGFSARWPEEPAAGKNWVAGVAIFHMGDGPEILTRVSLIFDGAVLTHGHFSVEGNMYAG